MQFQRSVQAALLAGILCLPAAALAADPICKPPANGDWSTWLKKQEDAGGHAKKCHVGIQANGLIGRITDRGGNNTGVCAQTGFASSWTDEKALTSAIKAQVTSNWQQATTAGAGNVQLSDKGSAKLGTTVSKYDGPPDKNRSPCGTNKAYVCKDAKAWRAYLARDANGNCHLITAFPE